VIRSATTADAEAICGIYNHYIKARKAYQHVLEVTVYTSHTNTVKGVGTKVYQALFDELKNYPADKQVKALMAVVALPNEASVGIHKKLGFYKAGYFKQVGRKFDQWIDVAYYQKDLF